MEVVFERQSSRDNERVRSIDISGQTATNDFQILHKILQSPNELPRALAHIKPQNLGCLSKGFCVLKRKHGWP